MGNFKSTSHTGCDSNNGSNNDSQKEQKIVKVPQAPPSVLISDLANIKGVFDIHITCDEQDIYLFHQFCVINGLSSAFAVGLKGTHKQQLMTGKEYQNGTGEEMVSYALELKQRMEDFGINVLRVKIESLAQNDGVAAFAGRSDIENNKTYYYEFHFKVKINSMDDQNKMDLVCRTFGASYALNIFSKNKKDPLITLRSKGSYKWACGQRDLLIQKLTEAGLERMLDGTYNEFVIYDDNLALDEGFVPDPIVPVTQKQN